MAGADRVTLDSGDTVEGIVQDRGENIRLQYLSSQGKGYVLKSMTIPRSRVKNVVKDGSYIQKYQGVIQGIGGAGISFSSKVQARPDTLQKDIDRDKDSLQTTLDEGREHLRQTKFYSGWHEGFHWDPPNGWHRDNHQGLYDPGDPNITVRE